MEAILADAIYKGAVRKDGLAHRWTWNAAGNCMRPPDVQLVARTEYKGALHSRVHPVEARTVMLDMNVPCRLCDECRARKAAHWKFRAQAEIAHWPRTWFGTLTLSTESQYLMKLRAADNLGWKRKPKGATTTLRFEDLTEGEQFQLRCTEIGKEIQLYQKRFRKAAGGKYRMLVVFEQHESGLPHAHMLVHECDALAPVRKKTLQEQWRLGFSSFKLVDKTNPSSGSYICKYIAKENLSRVRASQFYGLSQETLSEPSVEKYCF